MELYYHPLSRYSQKVLIALYEKQVNFHPRVIDLNEAFSRTSFRQVYAPGRLPLLKTLNDRLLPESSIIIEHIDTLFNTGTQLIPEDKEQALDVRLYDRLSDNHLNNVLFELEGQKQNGDELNQIKIKQLENGILDVFEELDERLSSHHWLCGECLTLADCALIPCLLSARSYFQLLDYEHLGRYWIQAQLRGAVIQVTEEIELALLDAPNHRRPHCR